VPSGVVASHRQWLELCARSPATMQIESTAY
jgi:hypothetical protein